jgi:RNA polymerase sigma-70 factor, ECF subfamily
MVLGDLELARRLGTGDESAFEDFFAAYFPRVYRYARVRLRANDEAAQEVAQATIIKALAKVHTYRGEAALFTWLCSICRREITAWFRRNGMPRVSLRDEPAETRAVLEAVIALSGDDPEREYERRELAGRVRAALERLPVQYRDALAARYLDGASVEEVGRRLSLGYKAAESLLTRARQAFRETFAASAGRSLQEPSAVSELGSSDE